MKTSLICAGFGGQGVMMAGQILCYTAIETTDKNVTYFPSYGVEMRGGTANCYVVISDKMIGAPMTSHVNNLMIFNGPSLEKFTGYLEPGGNMFINTSVVKTEPDRDDINIIKVDAGSIAYQLGSIKCMNLVMAGALVGYTDILPVENCVKTIIKKLGAKRPEMNEINEAAFRKGVEIGQAAKMQKK